MLSEQDTSAENKQVCVWEGQIGGALEGWLHSKIPQMQAYPQHYPSGAGGIVGRKFHYKGVCFLMCC